MICVDLSAAGEKYVNVQIKESLLRVTQVKEKMEKEKEKHKHLMEEVKYSGDKKRSGSTSASPDESDGGFLKSWGLVRVFYSAFAFGKDVLEELTDEYFHHSNREMINSLLMSKDAESLSSFGQHPNGYLCRTLRRQASECWQLQNLCENCGSNLIKECPRLQQLHSEMEEMHTLLNVSRLQYDDRLQLVRRHTADTQRWLADTGDEYGWISWVANVSGAQSNIFRVIAVRLENNLQSKVEMMLTNSPGADSSVVVSVLDSAPLTVSVPAALMVEDPAFMEYIAHHALTLYKQHIRRKCSS
uniref:Clusterin C-terminal domain-containing protein n=1 Tax=Poecilia reticulata TaxID=8081 RepID=A0A3P9NP29_POERE